MAFMMEADKPHHDPLPIELIRYHRIPISCLNIRQQCMDGTDSTTPKARECKAEWVGDEGNVLFEEFLVHLLEEQEVLADLVCEVYVLVVQL